MSWRAKFWDGINFSAGDLALADGLNFSADGLHFSPDGLIFCPDWLKFSPY